jgi:DNA polymerase III subunit epsilon
MSGPWHLGMMCAFDIESTGPDPETARLVTACVAWVDGSGNTPPASRGWLVDPGCDIPEQATAIHGITTAHARENGVPAAAALPEVTGELIRAASAGTPVIAYNAPYDLTVLDRETRRHGMAAFGGELDAAKGTIVDPFVLDKALDPYRKGSRKLADVAAHYGVKAGEAHTAAGDAVTAARVAWKIAAAYPHVGRMSLTELHAFQVKAKAGQARSFQDYLRRTGSAEVVDGSWPLRAWTGEAA